MFAVTGYSGTGKTELIEQLVPALKQRGYSVAVVKSSKEDVRPPKGTDTFRHLRASASPVVLLGPTTTTVRYHRRLDSTELFNGIEVDFILLEGFKSVALPRVLCIGDKELNKSRIPEGTYAIIIWKKTDLEERINLPVLQSDETERIVSLIEATAMDHQHISF